MNGCHKGERDQQHHSEYLRRGVFTCVGWKVTLCDSIWQVTTRSSEMKSSLLVFI